MSEETLFTDTIPYPTGSIERKRNERNDTITGLKILGASNTATFEDDLDTTCYHVIGNARRDVDVERIQRFLKRRGGKNFTQQQFGVK